jgi:osmotically-inducible protein OsmY
MRAAILAVSAMIGLTACNKEAKRDANEASAEAQEEARQTNRDVQEGAANTRDAASGTGRDAQPGQADEADQVGRKAETSARDQGAREGTGAMADSIRGEARQTGRDIKEGAQAATSKAQEEARQSGRDVKEGTASATSKAREETRQSARDVGEAAGMDKSTTEADRNLTARIRTALKADKDVASEQDDIRIITDKGEVKLIGTVTSKEVKSEISRIAKDVAGMTKVNDEMKVAERVGSGAND